MEIPLSHARCRSGLTSPRLQLGASLNELISSEGAIVTTTTTQSDGGTTTVTDSRGGGHALLGVAVGIEIPF